MPMKDFYLKTGMYGINAPFLTDPQQRMMLNQVFVNNGDSDRSRLMLPYDLTQLKRCPKCAEEDRKQYGTFYYRRSHQILGVTTCWKHHVPLEVYCGTRLHELEEGQPFKILPSVLQNVPYAMFAHDFLEADIQISNRQLKEVIHKILVEKFNNDFDVFQDELFVSYGEILTKQAKNNLLFMIDGDAYMSCQDILVSLFFLFDTVAKLKTYIVPEKVDINTELLHKNHCQLIGSTDPHIVEIEDNQGRRTCIHPTALTNNWQGMCPKVDRSTMRKAYTAETFMQEVNKLVGDAYSLAEPFDCSKRNVALRHNKCGQIHVYSKDRFLTGQRCPACSIPQTEKQFIESVSKMSHGRYVIEAKRSFRRYTVLDTKTQNRFDLEQKHILQELNRPTVSPLLPMDTAVDSVKPTAKWLTLLEYINHNCPHGDVIITGDIDIEGFTKQSLSGAFRTLMKKGYVKSIGEGLYCYPDDKFTPEEVVVSKYIFRGGKHIGYFIGNTALYKMGIVSEPPKLFTFRSNRMSSNNTEGTHTKAAGMEIFAKGPFAEITEKNWEIQMILDLLVAFPTYVSLYDMAGKEAIWQSLIQYVQQRHYQLEEFSKYLQHFNCFRVLRGLLIGKPLNQIYLTYGTGSKSGETE